MSRTTRKALHKVRELISPVTSFLDWRARGYIDHSPQFVKQSVLKMRGIPNAPWIETGTYLGTTTNFLARIAPHVYTIEPEPTLSANAEHRFLNRNVSVFQGTSEHVLPKLIPTLKGELNFWLDGHYSAGITYRGNKDCPIKDELAVIADSLDSFDELAIFIDDVRYFLHPPQVSTYPSIEYLVDWARQYTFSWRIEHDILLLHKKIRPNQPSPTLPDTHE